MKKFLTIIIFSIFINLSAQSDLSIQGQGVVYKKQFLSDSSDGQIEKSIATHPVLYNGVLNTTFEITFRGACKKGPIYSQQAYSALAYISPTEKGFSVQVFNITTVGVWGNSQSIEDFWLKKNQWRRGKNHQRAQACFTDQLTGLFDRL